MKIINDGINDVRNYNKVVNKIYKFIEDNNKSFSEEKLYDIFSLFILESEYYKKQTKLSILK